MLKLIVVRELREILSSAKFAVTFAVCSLLILLSFYLGARGYHAGVTQHEAALAEERRQLEGQTDWLSVSPTVALPPQPLAYIVAGVSNDIGRNTRVLGRGVLRPVDSRFDEDPILALFRFVDLEFTFQVVLSLLAILFAYDAVCGERERGTLRLTMAHAVPRGTLILGKMAGAFLGLAVPLLIPLAMGSIVLIVMQVPMSGDEWLRLGLIIVAGYLLVGAVLGLSILVSSLTRDSASAFVVLLSLWVVAVLIVPRAAVLVAGRAVDVPSIDVQLSQLSRLRAQLWSEDHEKISDFLNVDAEGGDGEDAEAIMAARIGQFNEFFDGLGKERERQLGELEVRLSEDRYNRQEWQQRLAFGLARVSPASAFSLAVADLAGTSLELPRRYLESVKEYQRRFSAFQEKKTGRTGGGVRMIVRSSSGGEEPSRPEAIDPRELPVFHFSPPPLAEVVKNAVTDLTLLALFNLLFFAGAYVAFLRYDVR